LHQLMSEINRKLVLQHAMEAQKKKIAN